MFSVFPIYGVIRDLILIFVFILCECSQMKMLITKKNHDQQTSVCVMKGTGESRHIFRRKFCYCKAIQSKEGIQRI